MEAQNPKRRWPLVDGEFDARTYARMVMPSSSPATWLLLRSGVLANGASFRGGPWWLQGAVAGASVAQFSGKDEAARCTRICCDSLMVMQVRDDDETVVATARFVVGSVKKVVENNGDCWRDPWWLP